jgi:DNA modification methylase
MEEAKIKNRVLKTSPIKWKELSFIQDENFKEWINEGDEKLVKSLLRYQFADPFKVWENDGKIYCLDGKHRYLDLLRIESTGVEVPEYLPATFIDCRDKNEAAELVLVYSSYYAKITQQGLFDFVSKFELSLPNLSDKINIPEFSTARFEQKFNLFNIDSSEEDEVEVSECDIVVKQNDIFQLNEHRIICGSFTEKKDIEQLLQGEKARIINCDPPYNLPADFFTNKNGKKHKDFAMGSGEMSDDEFIRFLALIMQMSVENSVDGAIHYIFMDFRHCWHMGQAAKQVYGNPQPKQVCVWAKDIIANGSFYRAQHELCFVFLDEKAKSLWNRDLIDEGGSFYKDNNEWCFVFKNGDGAKHLSHLELKDRIRSNVWKYPSATSMANPDRFELKNHPTPKPVAMIADAILDTTNDNDIVIDWFLGSGTCLIACEHTRRRGRFTEIEPKYVQSSILRYLNYCKKRGICVNFTHLNGKLTIKDFEDVKLQNSNRDER